MRGVETTPATPHLLVIDLPNLVSRCWHAQPVFCDARGLPIHAISGALTTVARVARATVPGDLSVAMDSPVSFRKQSVPDYKRKRLQRDPDLIRQEQTAADLLRRCGWAVVEALGYEADDVIASITSLYPGRVTVLSGDRDMLALCSERVAVNLLRSAGPDMLCDGSEALQLFGVRPEQLTDYKALAGDPGDGIAGVTGIGPRTAVALLTECGDLDALFAVAARGGLTPDVCHRLGVPATVPQRLLAHREEALRSRFLARMVPDLGLEQPEWAPVAQCFSDHAVARARAYGATELAPRLAPARSAAAPSHAEPSLGLPF
jgi:DNA polymerase-1